jgi:glutaredoxin
MKVYLIYGISDCPACLKAQALLMEQDKEYVFINADFSKTYRDAIKEEFVWKTFPIVIKVTQDREELVGGYDDLLYVLEKEQLTPT